VRVQENQTAFSTARCFRRPRLARTAGLRPDGSGEGRLRRAGLACACREGAEAHAGGTEVSWRRRRAALIQKRLPRWRRSGGAAAETGAPAETAGTSARRGHTRVGVKHAAQASGTLPWEAREALGGRAGRRPACAPHSLAARGAPSGAGPDDGCRGRCSDPRGAVRRRPRPRRPGGHAPERAGAGLLPVADAGGASG
jgi:hypothetical protein